MRMLDRSGSHGKPEAGPSPAGTLRRLGLSRAILPRRTRPILTALVASLVLAGSGALAAVPVALGAAPDAPTGVTAVAGNGQARVSWTAPANNGGSTIILYTVYSMVDANECTVSNPQPDTPLTCVVNGLANGTPATFEVIATNLSDGDGPPSLDSNAVTPDGSLPTEPGTPTATSGFLSANVSWGGSSGATSYTVTSSPDGQTCTTGGTSCNVPNLLAGTSYTFTVVAHGSGNSIASDASNSVTPTDVPSQPAKPTAVPHNASATVSWAAPSDGGLTITSYTVTSSPDNQTCGWTSGPLNCTVTGLTNKAYTFTVTAHNANGDSLPSASSDSVTVTTVPAKPAAPSATAGSTVADVTWTAPSDGGSIITSYTVVSSPATSTCTWTTGPLSCHFTGLTNGQHYTFTVTAHNINGPSTASDPSNSVTPATVPGKPNAPTATAGNTVADVTWTAPSDDGGATITSYTVVSSPATTTCTWTTGPLSCHFTGLTNGQAYTFTVTAHNSVGASTTSDASTPVTPSTVPAKPAAPSATSGNLVADVTWTAPSDGGSPITSYTVVSSPATTTCTWTTGPLTCHFTGLTNGQAYTFTVTAHNANGAGLTSDASTPVTPSTTPGQPAAPTITGVANQSATVNWVAPGTGGAAIDSYTVVSSPATTTCTWTTGPLTCPFTTLTNGTSYTFTVTAHNINGNSLTSDASTPVTPSTVPGQPLAPVVQAGNKVVVLTWVQPDTGGSPITSYMVKSVTPDASKSCTWTTGLLTCTVTGLTNGQSYTFTVTAHNANGDGLASPVSAAVIPAAVPDKVVGVSATRGNGQATIHWAIPNNNGNPLTGFTVTDGAGHTCSGGPADVACTVTGLANGTPYSFTVLASNTVGPGPASDPVVVTPATVPGKPTGVNVVRGNQSVNVSWVAPLNGGAPIISYTVSDGAGHTCTGGAAATNCTVTGLTNGTAYTFTVTATNSVGSTTSDPSESITPISGATYHALPPARILDTRSGNGLSGLLGSHQARTFTVWNRGGVPYGATAVTGNLTVTQQSRQGFLFIGPSPQDYPTSSTLNFPTGDDRANAVTVALSASGTLSVTYAAPTLGPTAHAIFDVTGYFTADLSGASYSPLTPTRILDTRNGTGGIGVLSSHVAQGFPVRNQGGVPANATAVTGNLTVTQQQAMGFLFIGPDPMNNPTSSTLNFPVRDDRANAVTVQIGGDGKLWVTYAAPYLGPTAHAIFDVTGYFTNDSSGALWFPLNPTRILDTRTGMGGLGIASSHVAQTFTVRGRGQVPSDATAVTGNLTVTQQQLQGFLFVGPVPMNDPTSSTLNFPYGDDRANSVTVRLDGNGGLSVTYAAPVRGPTAHVIFDVTGYFVR